MTTKKKPTSDEAQSKAVDALLNGFAATLDAVGVLVVSLPRDPKLRKEGVWLSVLDKGHCAPELVDLSVKLLQHYRMRSLVEALVESVAKPPKTRRKRLTTKTGK